MDLLDLAASELAVIEMLCKGYLIKQIAWERGTSIKTVESQIKRAKEKNEAKTIHELCARFAASRVAYEYQQRSVSA